MKQYNAWPTISVPTYQLIKDILKQVKLIISSSEQSEASFLFATETNNAWLFFCWGYKNLPFSVFVLGKHIFAMSATYEVCPESMQPCNIKNRDIY